MAIVIPVFEDWDCLQVLSVRLHVVLADAGWIPIIIAVDDGSSRSPAGDRAEGASIVVRLARNVGHQRAIAVGLDYAVREIAVDHFAIMDSDGEDRPEDLPALLERFPGQQGMIVVASRRRRSEGTRFIISYLAYKAVFRILTGQRLDFGNFSVLDRVAALRLTAMHELWLNLPATIMRSRLHLVRLATDRGERYAGKSRMNFVGLVIHGLSAVGVFAERAFTRVILAVGVVAFLLLVGLVAGLTLKSAGLATPGWVTTIASALVIVLIQAAMVALSGLFIVFGNAANVGNHPSATARALVSSVEARSTGD